MNVAQIMNPQVITIAPGDSVLQAEETMTREQIRHLPVVDGDILLGIISQRDIMAVSLPSISVPSEEDDLDFKSRLRVEKIMHHVVESVHPDTDAVEAACELLDLKIGCLPVVDDRRKVVGIVTEADYVRLARDLLRAEASSGHPRRRAG